MTEAALTVTVAEVCDHAEYTGRNKAATARMDSKRFPTGVHPWKSCAMRKFRTNGYYLRLTRMHKARLGENRWPIWVVRERNKWKKIFAYYNHCARCLNQGYRSGEIVAMILVLGARYWRHFEKYPALEEVWSPLLTSSKPILFCMGGMTVNALPSGSQLAQLQSGADENPSIQALADKFDVVPYSDGRSLRTCFPDSEFLDDRSLSASGRAVCFDWRDEQ